MKKRNLTGYIIGAVVLLIGLYMIVTFNGLVKKEEKVTLQWNEVQNAYQRRSDLVPNIANVVKGGAAYEQETLRQLTEARAKATSAGGSGELTSENYRKQTAAQDELASAANRLLITVEKYPELQGTRAFKDLQVQLVGTERRIKVSRNNFNNAIADYNRSVRSFPTKLVAGLLGFKAKEGFSADAGSDKSVEINFKN